MLRVQLGDGEGYVRLRVRGLYGDGQHRLIGMLGNGGQRVLGFQRQQAGDDFII